MSIETNTKIDLISKALVVLGEKPLQSLGDDRYGATVGGSLFEMIYENELQSNPWRFACTKKQLARLTSAPLNQWENAFQLPPDMLLPLYVYPRTPYEIYGDHLYTDSDTVELDFMFKPEVSKVPAYFSALLVYALARDMADPITASKDAVKLLTNRYILQRNRALYADAQGRPATPIQDSPFTDVR